MADVIHDPKTDWCSCVPFSVNRCDYRLLADEVITRLNPPDGDEAEVSLCIAALDGIACHVESLPCTCPAGGEEPCGRCAVLGQHHGKPIGR
jgi:hypothetical protein